MSNQPEDIFQEISQLEKESQDISTEASTSGVHFSQHLQQYGKESDPLSALDSNSFKMRQEEICSINPMEFSATPSTSGSSFNRIPYPMSDYDDSYAATNVTHSDSISYINFEKTITPIDFGATPNVTTDPYNFFIEDYSSLYSTPSTTEVKNTSAITTVSDISYRAAAAISSTEIQPTQHVVSQPQKTKIRRAAEYSQKYRTSGRPRRGRRRGQRRGSYYSQRLLHGPPHESGDSGENLERFENRNIREEAKQAYIQITEQPQQKALRFRYICEGRSAGSIPGIHSSSTRKTFPTIRVVNSRGPALAVVSCVTVNPPYRPHPHNLVGKEGCEDGVCSVLIDNEMMECSFSNLGIQCVKKKDIEKSLSMRAQKMIDPFQTGYDHQSQLQAVDLNSIRLCFQVYLIDRRSGERFPLQPIVSDPIYDKKATTDLMIYKLSACSSCVTGGKEIILLCDKIAKDDVQVRFFEEKDGQIEWEAFGEFQASDVHKQVAISFKTPKYKDIEIDQIAKVWIQLFRPSDKSASEPVPFEYYQVNKDCEYFEDKILHIANPSSKEVSTSGSPLTESLHGASDEGEVTETSGTGDLSTSVVQTRSSASHSYGSKLGKRTSRSQEFHEFKRQTRFKVSERQERKLSTYSGRSFSDPELKFEQTYFPQLEGIQPTEYKPQILTTLASSSAMSTSPLPMGPTATLAPSEKLNLQSELDSSGGLQYLDMDLSSAAQEKSKDDSSHRTEGAALAVNIPEVLEKERTRESSLSPNSENIKRLKQDIETLNKLSYL